MTRQKIQCDKCRASIYEHHMDRHKRSKSCLRNQEINAIMDPVEEEMKAKDWIRVGHHGWTATLEKAGVPFERRPVAAYWNSSIGQVEVPDGYWAPRWACDIVRNDAKINKRVRVLELCMKDAEKRDAIHSIMLMTNKRKRAAALNRLYDDWGLQPNTRKRRKEK